MTPDEEAQAIGFRNAITRSAADRAIDTFVRTGGYAHSDADARCVVRWLLLRGLLIEQRNIKHGIAASPLHRILASSESVYGPIGRITTFIDVLRPPEELPLSVIRAATSRAGGRCPEFWTTDRIVRGKTENVVLGVSDGSVVTSFELATQHFEPARILPECEVNIQEVDAKGLVGATIVSWRACGTGSDPFKHRDFVAERVVVDTVATRFKFSIRHKGPFGSFERHLRSAGMIRSGPSKGEHGYGACLAIARAHGSPSRESSAPPAMLPPTSCLEKEWSEKDQRRAESEMASRQMKQYREMQMLMQGRT